MILRVRPQLNAFYSSFGLRPFDVLLLDEVSAASGCFCARFSASKIPPMNTEQKRFSKGRNGSTLKNERIRRKMKKMTNARYSSESSMSMWPLKSRRKKMAATVLAFVTLNDQHKVNTSMRFTMLSETTLTLCSCYDVLR